MLHNYITTAIRNIWKNKVFSSINVLGLATGLACCFLISVYIDHHLSYDRFHSQAERIARVTMEYGAGESARNVPVTGTKVLPELKRTFPEIETGVRFMQDRAVVRHDDKIFDEWGFVYADATLFDVFSFKLLEGNPRTALAKPNSVILSRSMARKYFGEMGSPMGQTLRIDNQSDYLVTGIVEDCPVNSQIKFNFLASFSSLEASKTEEWWDANYITYLLLSSPGSIGPLQEKVDHHLKQQSDVNGKDSHLSLFLQPLLRVHLHSIADGGFEPAGDIRYIYIFSAIALLILGIAIANYVNLTTAKAAERAKEVGMRKVMGAMRRQLIGQFLGESFVLVSLAVIISFVIAQVLLPTFNALSGVNFAASIILKPIPLVTLAGIALIIVLLGGGYPAFVLSRFAPAATLKGNFRPASFGITLRSVLIVVQFVISGGLIISTLIIRDQLDFIQNKKLGYDVRQVLSLPVTDQIRGQATVLKKVLENYPGIASVTVASRTPVEVSSTSSIQVGGVSLLVNQIRTDKDFVKTLGVTLVSGADFTEADEKAALETGNHQPLPAIILNRAAAEAFHWSPEEAIGKVMDFRSQKMEVKAVVENFHFASMRQEIAAMVIFIGGYVSRMIVKVSGDDLAKTIDFIHGQWSVQIPEHPFEYEFLDDQFNSLYATETRTGKIFYSFALLAIGLACLGLLGLVAFSAQQRTKEIGIRKVLGASANSIFLLLSRDFFVMVIIALCIASPAAYAIMNSWLADFAYHIAIDWTAFAVAGFVSLAVVLVTISIQAARTIVENPVKALRNE